MSILHGFSGRKVKSWFWVYVEIRQRDLAMPDSQQMHSLFFTNQENGLQFWLRHRLLAEPQVALSDPNVDGF